MILWFQVIHAGVAKDVLTTVTTHTDAAKKTMDGHILTAGGKAEGVAAKAHEKISNLKIPTGASTTSSPKAEAPVSGAPADKATAAPSPI